MKRLYVETFVCKKEKKLLTIETKLCIIEWQTDETAVCKYFLEKYSRGRRGAPAKGVGRATGARVQISPSPPTKKELLSTKSSFFVYPSRRLGISSPHKVRCISSAPLGLYLITRQRVFFLRLDEMQHCVLMIYNSFGIDDIQGFALICLYHQREPSPLLFFVVLTKKKRLDRSRTYGADYETRTRYLHLGKVTLYRMS